MQTAHQEAQEQVQAAHQEALAMRAEAQTIRDEAHAYVIRMLEQATLARQRMFGASSEQMSAQSRLFDEAEVLAQNSTDAQDTAPIADEAPLGVPATAAPATKPARGKRAPLAAGLPRVDVLHDVPEADRTCPCGTTMVLIGQDISEQLDIVPMQVRVIRNIRNRYGCPGSQHAPVTAPLPPQPLPKSNASADFLAMLYTVKFVDGMPLTRFGKVLERHNAPVPSQTLARWVIAGSGLLQPLHNLMRDVLLDCSLIHMDETVVQVLKEPGKAPTSNSYMWVQTGGPPDKPVVLFDYDPSRSAQVPTRLLEGFKGYLMTDGYSGYGDIGRTTGIERLACWAHVRRRFVEAVRVQPKGKRGKAIPIRIERADGAPMGLAGLWSWWKSPQGEVVHSYTMLTINAEDHPLMRLFHKPTDEKRMVVILPDDRYDDWLNASPEHSHSLLRQYPAPALQAMPAFAAPAERSQ